jgi:hypothetical protein
MQRMSGIHDPPTMRDPGIDLSRPPAPHLPRLPRGAETKINLPPS